MFKVGIVLKGINGALELLGGVLLLAIPRNTLPRVAWFLTHHDPSRGAGEWIFRKAGQGLDEMNGAPAFAVFYLLSHGAVKVFLSIALLRDARWSYPVALGVFGLLLGFEVYRFGDHPSVILGVVIGIDAAIIALIGVHWRTEGDRACRPA